MCLVGRKLVDRPRTAEHCNDECRYCRRPPDKNKWWYRCVYCGVQLRAGIQTSQLMTDSARGTNLWKKVDSV